MTPAPRWKIFNIVGVRPDMVKMAAIISEMRRHSDLQSILVHTGQHYDYAMSQVFLEQLQMGDPEHNLQVGSGSHHQQTAEIMKRFGQLVEEKRPDLIVVSGDVNSTLACTLVAAKERIPVAQVEAGLRSFDRRMPEEVNRIVTDSLAELLFTSEECANENLRREGIPAQKIFFVGNVMIDTLTHNLDRARRSRVIDQLGLRSRRYCLVTLHRPSNVDEPEKLAETIRNLAELSDEIPIVFSVHPRSAIRVRQLSIPNVQEWDEISPVSDRGICFTRPFSYLDFLCLIDRAVMVITDSGGIQEETTYLGVPCLTYRENTERPVTVTRGTNRLVGTAARNLISEARAILSRPPTSTQPPPLWDGNAAKRIVSVIRSYFAERSSRLEGAP